MKHLFTTLILFCCIIGSAVAEYEYPYKRNSVSKSEKTLSIREYIGESQETLIIPKQIHDSTVTELYTILKTTNKSVIKQLFLPPDVEISYTLTKNRQDIEYGVIESNTTFSSDLAATAFYFDNNIAKDKIILKTIYTFGSQYEKKNLVGSGASTELELLGKIIILYNDNTTDDVFMYNWGYGSKENERKIIDLSKYNFLLKALGHHTNKTICTIDFSNLNNNGAIYNFGDFDPSSLLPAGATVIIDQNTAYNPTIPDLTDYTTPSIDLTTTIHYTRSNTKDWNSVCLPFALYESDFPEDSNTKIYTISGADEERIKLTHVESVAAGEPCFICSKAENWNLTLTDREIKSTTQAGITEIEGWKMFGSFQEAEIGAGKFKLDSDGKSIGQTATNKARVYPFRCYLECTLPNGAPERFLVDIEGEEQSITLTEKDDEVSDTFYIDLSGRRIQGSSEPRLIKGRNIIIR